jgi:uncharacterized Fe-S cluster-containing protein
MFSRKKYTEEDMQEAIDRATDVAFRAGYQQAIADVNQVIDSHQMGIVLKHQPESFAVRQAAVILQKKELEEGEL